MNTFLLPARAGSRFACRLLLGGLLLAAFPGGVFAQPGPDTTAPTIVEVGSADGSSVTICFSEVVNPDFANDRFNYFVDNGTITTDSALLSPNGVTVTLAVSGLSSVPGTTFTVIAENIYDLAGNLGTGTLEGRVGDVVRCLRPNVPTDPRITSLGAGGLLTWTNVSTNGICTIEFAANLAGAWMPGPNYYTSNGVGGAVIPLPPGNTFYRLLSMPITPTAEGFTNLINSYGYLHTVAGYPASRVDGVNNWQDTFEGGPASLVSFSRPHFAIADRFDNIYVADKDNHSIIKITPDGTVHTVAGTHYYGCNGDGPAPGTTLQLTTPTGEWMHDDGTLYILDTGNGKIRRLDTNGILSTLFTITNGLQAAINGIIITNGIQGGRGLYVNDDETLVYFTTDHVLWRWTPDNFTTPVNTEFVEMGNIAVLVSGQIVATDRGGHQVWMVETNGTRTLLAGNGSPFPALDGGLGVDAGLNGVRGVWPVPTGGFLLACHEGGQIWYLDAAGIIHLLVDGAKSRTIHDGDGDWFHSPGLKISSPRSVTMDYHGNILIMESDYGYVRKIDFTRLQP